ncbi:helix-turn-helix domain-containing protein [Paenibacillus sp. USDA918EY]|uniref:helix-turn-helix domain-containing protein n=1 Tax=Paenibacillus sp. USDA918EY TaxID=2689575 RepID=UPI001F32726A|nr:helix-turn-helix domain-containing protein [Paenibacillus sp. USDA918EY]
MNKTNELKYLKQRLADLQQYLNREIEMIMNDVKRLEDIEFENPEKLDSAEGMKDAVSTWDHLPDVLTPTDIQQILRIGRNQTYDLIKSGQINYVKAGRKLLIPKSSFVNWLDGKETAR